MSEELRQEDVERILTDAIRRKEDGTLRDALNASGEELGLTDEEVSQAEDRLRRQKNYKTYMDERAARRSRLFKVWIGIWAGISVIAALNWPALADLYTRKPMAILLGLPLFLLVTFFGVYALEWETAPTFEHWLKRRALAGEDDDDPGNVPD